MAEQWLDYRQLGELWKMSPEAARTRARRGNYQRRVGNQGQAEVLVDLDAPVRRPRPPRSGGQSQTTSPLPTPDAATPPAATAEALGAIAALEAHVVTLKAALAQAEALASDRGREVAVERERVADLTAQLLRLTTELLDARKPAEAAPRRSWWQRLTG
jgi:hypothetical protein